VTSIVHQTSKYGSSSSPPPPERGSQTITITAAGLAKREQARRCWQQARQRLNDRLRPGRVAALHALIDESLGLLDADLDEATDD